MYAAVVAQTRGTLGGSSLASWDELVFLVVGFLVVVAVLYALGDAEPSWGGLRHLARVPRGLTRVTGIPGWAAVSVGLSLFGLLVAGQGFYSDVSWHIALGRDDDLFTAPHTSILVGLVAILGAAVLGTVTATLERVPGLRVGALRVPPSLLPMWALGLGAVAGFPLDEVWHSTYGIDVTMWSPTHMLMILGASFSGLAAWIVLAGAGVRPTDGRWARGVHVLCAWLTLQGSVASLGEFAFGVPQFSQLFHPVIVCLAAGLGLVTARLVLGRGWTVGVATVSFLLLAGPLDLGGEGPATMRQGATFVVSAVVVELAALGLGTDRRLRFALVAGVGIGTFGLASEWAWNQGAAQPWTTALLPEAVLFGLAAALGAAVLGGVVGGAVAGDRVTVPGPAVAVAAVVCVGVLLAPMPRRVGDVRVAIDVTRDGDVAEIEATLTPADAADDARWFQATAWQGGGLVVVDMVATDEPGVWRSDRPVPVTGHWKTLLRLHRGGEMMAAPVWFPADPDIGEGEVPAEDREVAFGSERTYLMREADERATGILSPLVHGLLAAAAAGWALAFAVAVRSLRRAAAPSERSEPVPSA